MAFDLADQARIGVRASLERVGARPSRTGRKLTPRIRDELLATLAKGEFLNIYAFSEGAAAGFQLAVRGADVYDTALTRIHDAGAREKMLAAQAAHPSPRFLNLAIARQLEDVLAIITTAKKVFASVDGACGFIGHSPAQLASGDQTAYEMSRMRFWTSQPDVFKTRLRGAFWGNFLSPTHVELLGGIARVQREAPCSVEPLEFSNGAHGAYLQLDGQSVSVLQEYLAELLP